MFEERHDIIHRLTAAGAGKPGMAAERPTLTEASPASVVPTSVPPTSVAPASVLPGAISIGAPGPGAWEPAIPNQALSRRRGMRGRRTGMACPRGPVWAPGTFRRGAEGRSNALRPGGTARGPKRYAETIGCAPIQGAQAGFPGAGLLAITVVIRSNMSISLAHVRPGAPPAGHGPGLPAPSKPLIYNGF